MSNLPQDRHRTSASSTDHHPQPSASHPHSSSPSPSPTTRPETYLCTFCWRPQRVRTTPSRVVGRGARLACEPCYNALLGLAVCWVCGEVVFRGDECVSLGWCFWHRGCYGCLVCGDRRVVEGLTVGELFDDGGDGDGGESGGIDDVNGNKGREVDEVPLCGKCADELARDKAGDEQLVPMALRRIDRFDGGLSRRRWEAGMGRLPQRQTDLEGEHAREARTGDSFAGEVVGTHDARAQVRRFETSTTRTRPLDRAEPDRRHASSPVYVSMHDPVGGPSFRPSKTKPIPRWMRDLPSQRQCAKDCADRPASVLENYFSPTETSITDSDTEPGARVPTPPSSPPPPPPPPVPPHTVPMRTAIPSVHELVSTPPAGLNTSIRSVTSTRPDPNLAPTTTRRDPAFSPFQMSRPFTLIAEEPAQRPSSKLGAGRVPPSRHVRFINPPQASTSSTASSRRSERPSESSDYLERYSGRHDHHVGGDGMIEPVNDAKLPGPVLSSQDQLKKVFGLS